MTASRRQSLIVLAAALGVIGSLTTAQLILSQRTWRLDLTPEQRYVLSPHARKILDDLDQDVEITAFVRSDDPRNPDTEDLLWRIDSASDRVRHQIIDVNRNPALARRYGVSSYGAVVVQSDGRRKQFTNPNEALLMAAIVQVTRPGRQRVYFLSGHGEHNPRDRDRERGYSSARLALIQELYEVEELGLVGERGVPADASVLVVAGPQSNLLPSELSRIDEYVRRGGALLVLLDPGPTTGLAVLLERYGLSVSDQVVLDSENRLFAGDFLTMLVPGLSPQHPVSSALQTPPLMSQIRAVSARESGLAEGAIEVLKTSPSSWSTSDPEALETGVGRFLEGHDTRGPIAVGASVVVKNESGPPGRVLVYGDSSFATNFFLDYLGNRDLLLNSINWLAGETALIASRPPAQTPGVEQFFLSARHGRFIFWLGTIVQPLVVLLIGTLVFVRRQLLA